MESKQIKLDRILFLKKFTEELIINISRKHQIDRKVRIEKLRQKFLNPQISMQQGFKKIINHKILHPVKYPKTDYQEENLVPSIATTQKKPLFYRKEPPSKLPIPFKKQIQPPSYKKASEVQPEVFAPKEGLKLGKLEPLLNDKFIQSLECIGPGKNLLVRKYNKISLTKIILSQEEINEIVNSFSQEAKIPLAGGILKAAVGDFLISAVTSEHVGSRFIISRINPYLMNS